MPDLYNVMAMYIKSTYKEYFHHYLKTSVENVKFIRFILYTILLPDLMWQQSKLPAQILNYAASWEIEVVALKHETLKYLNRNYWSVTFVQFELTVNGC